jgi:hypothetical protein
MQLVQAREELNAALADLEAAHKAVQGATDGSTDHINRLRAEFNAAETSYRRARTDYEPR